MNDPRKAEEKYDPRRAQEKYERIVRVLNALTFALVVLVAGLLLSLVL
jgi:hypothetical protein